MSGNQAPLNPNSLSVSTANTETASEAEAKSPRIEPPLSPEIRAAHELFAHARTISWGSALSSVTPQTSEPTPPKPSTAERQSYVPVATPKPMP